MFQSKRLKIIKNKILETKEGRDLVRAISRLYSLFLAKAKNNKNGLNHPVVLSGISKSGTNLLLNVVLSIPGAKCKFDIAEGILFWGLESLSESPKTYFSLFERKVYDLRGGMVYVGHNPYTKEIADFIDRWRIKHILIIRDSRDYVISLARYISDPKVKHVRVHLFDSCKTEGEKVLIAISGAGRGRHTFDMSYDSITNVKIIYEVYEKWLEHKNTLVVKYEDFISEEGISPHIKDTMKKICEYLEIKADESIIKKMIIEGMNPKKSHTFRVGRSGQWKKIFTKEHFEAFEKVGGEYILKKFGYDFE